MSVPFSVLCINNKMSLVKHLKSKLFATHCILMVYLSYKITAAPLNESTKSVGTPR